MFILYAVAAGIAIGLARGGSPSRLGRIQFRWGGVILAGMAVQIALFSPAVSEWLGGVAPVIYVGSTAAVLLAVAVNRRITGIPVIVAGAAANLAAIVANGGYMPAEPGAFASTGGRFGTAYTNSSLVAHPALAPLTDIFALPAWLPGTNVFSVGDVLIGVGVAWAIMTAMRLDPRAPGSASPGIDGNRLPSRPSVAASRAGSAQSGPPGHSA